MKCILQVEKTKIFLSVMEITSILRSIQYSKTTHETLGSAGRKERLQFHLHNGNILHFIVSPAFQE